MIKIAAYFEKIDRVFSTISFVTLFIMMMWIFFDVVFRFLFNSPIPGTIEIIGEYFMVILIYFSLSYTQKKQEHVNVDIFIEKFPMKTKRIAKLIVNLIAAPFFLIISYLNFLRGLKFFEENIRSIGVLEYVLAPAYIIISLGLLMISLRLLIECISLFHPGKLMSHPPLSDSWKNT